MIEKEKKKEKVINEYFCRYVVKCIGRSIHPPTIVMELMHCNLEEFIAKKGRVNEIPVQQKIAMAIEIAKGLQILHNERVLYPTTFILYLSLSLSF